MTGALGFISIGREPVYLEMPINIFIELNVDDEQLGWWISSRLGIVTMVTHEVNNWHGCFRACYETLDQPNWKLESLKFEQCCNGCNSDGIPYTARRDSR